MEDRRLETPIQQEERRPFEEPKLTYVTPKLREQGKVEDVTQNPGFFGTFSP